MTKEKLLAEADKHGPRWLAANPVKVRFNPKWNDKDMAAFAVDFHLAQLQAAKESAEQGKVTCEKEILRLQDDLEKAEQQLAEARAQGMREAREIALAKFRRLNADAAYAARHGSPQGRERFECFARIAEGIATEIEQALEPQ